jgi:hypothetical protein
MPDENANVVNVLEGRTRFGELRYTGWSKLPCMPGRMLHFYIQKGYEDVARLRTC